jgi:hypothetical protein
MHLTQVNIHGKWAHQVDPKLWYYLRNEVAYHFNACSATPYVVSDTLSYFPPSLHK